MLYMNQQWPVTLPVALYMYSCCVLSSHWHGVDDVNVTLCRLNRHWTLQRTESTPLRLCLSHSTFLVSTLQYRSVNVLDIDNSSMRLQGICSHKLLYTYTQCLTQGWVHDVENMLQLLWWRTLSICYNKQSTAITSAIAASLYYDCVAFTSDCCNFYAQ